MNQLDRNRMDYSRLAKIHNAKAYIAHTVDHQPLRGSCLNEFMKRMVRCFISLLIRIKRFYYKSEEKTFYMIIDLHCPVTTLQVALIDPIASQLHGAHP